MIFIDTLYLVKDLVFNIIAHRGARRGSSVDHETLPIQGRWIFIYKNDILIKKIILYLYHTFNKYETHIYVNE